MQEHTSIDRPSLEHLPLFSQLSPEELDLFEKHGSLSEYQEGEHIFLEGEAASSFWVILSGAVEVVKTWGSGEEKLLQVMKPGDFIGELGVVQRNHVRTASARAAGPVKLLEVALSDLEHTLKRQSNLALPIMREAVARFLRTENAAIQDLVEKNQKLAQSLKELKAAQEQLIQQEKLEVELATARRIQEDFLPPSLLDMPGWELAVHWMPAREVGGDFYDLLSLPDGRTALVIGDVSGKGVPAALGMAVSRSLIRATIRSGGEAGDLLAQVNNLLVEEMPPSMFATAFVALLDPISGAIEFANAGHCLPLQKCAGEIAELRARGMPLGLMPEMAYEEGQSTLSPGEWVLFYSDAVLEASNPDRQLFGMERLHEAARLYNSQESASGLIHHLLKRLVEFTGPDAEQEDDLTLIVLRRPTG